MQTMNISLPDPLSEYVDEQITAGEYGSVSEYFRVLVRADQKRNAKEQLERSLLESLNEGEAQEATPEFWNTLGAEFDQQGKVKRSVPVS